MDAVMAFDLGTTHLKWVLMEEASGLRISGGQANISPKGTGGVSEQDPEQVLNIIQDALSVAMSHCRIDRVAFSAAMHTFMAVDSGGRAYTRSWTWMDKRAQQAARLLRQSEQADLLKQYTGVPVHPMSPLVKWLSIKQWLPAGTRPTSLKDYVIYHLTGQWVTDYSTAAATGFLGLNNCWFPQALAMAGVDANDLPVLAAMDHRISVPGQAWTVVVGGSDGACAHRHLQIPADGTMAVLAMGTSGALRTTVPQPIGNTELFCYTMGPGQGYLTGSAFSNVGNVLEWLARVFNVDINTIIAEGLDAARSSRSLPLNLAYWFGERSPWWRDDLRGAWLNIGPEHGRSELAGSSLLSIAAAYWHGLETLIKAGAPIREIRGGSGLLENPIVAQWMADALEHDIVLQDEGDASLFGAMDLAGTPGVPRPHHDATRYRPGDTNVHDRVKDTWQRIQAWVKSQL